MAHDVSVTGLYILNILGCPVSTISEDGKVAFIDEFRLTVTGATECMRRWPVRTS